MEVTDAMWRIIHELHRAAVLQRRAAATAPLGPVATGLLNLAAQAPVRPSAAAAALGVPAQSITRAAAELVGAGLAHRVGDDADGRSYAIELTDTGRGERDRFRAELTEQFGRHLVGWSDAEIVEFAGRLSGLVSSLVAEVRGTTAEAATRRSWRAR